MEKPKTSSVFIPFIRWGLLTTFSHLDILVVTFDGKFYLTPFLEGVQIKKQINNERKVSGGTVLAVFIPLATGG